MSETAARLIDELGRLPANERAEIAHYLLLSLHDDVDPEYDPQQDQDLHAELLRRQAEVESGAVQLLPAWQALAELRQKHS